MDVRRRGIRSATPTALGTSFLMLSMQRDRAGHPQSKNGRTLYKDRHLPSTISSSSVTNAESLVDLMDWFEEGGCEVKPFKILFVPDPTLSLINKSAVANDLAYVCAILTESELCLVSELAGVHVIKGTKVFMQEWVSLRSLCHQSRAANIRTSAVLDDSHVSMEPR